MSGKKLKEYYKVDPKKMSHEKGVFDRMKKKFRWSWVIISVLLIGFSIGGFKCYGWSSTTGYIFIMRDSSGNVEECLIVDESKISQAGCDDTTFYDEGGKKVSSYGTSWEVHYVRNGGCETESEIFNMLNMSPDMCRRID